MKYKIRLILVLLSIVILATAQEEDSTLTNKDLRKKRPQYIELGVGMALSSFRDLATSPLIYSALARGFSVAYLKQDSKRETKINVRLINGTYTSSLKDIATESSVTISDISFTKMYVLNKFSNENWNFKAGAFADLSADIRINKSLQNNALGIDVFFNLMASGKVTRDVSRKDAKHKKFLWIKYNLQPRQRDLSIKLNVGLINSSYRNPYAYAGQSSIVNKAVLLDGYEYKVFSGLRFSTEFIYTIYLKNKNAFQLSYIWDGYRTGGDLDRFGVVNHIFKFSFLFNLR